MITTLQKASAPVSARAEKPGGRMPTASQQWTLEGYCPSAAGSTMTGTERATGAMRQRTT